MPAINRAQREALRAYEDPVDRRDQVGQGSLHGLLAVEDRGVYGRRPEPEELELQHGAAFELSFVAVLSAPRWHLRRTGRLWHRMPSPPPRIVC